jgi:hypothetical protein
LLSTLLDRRRTLKSVQDGWSEAIPIMFWTMVMGFAKGSTHPCISAMAYDGAVP